MYDKRHQDAATKIQSLWRGKQARKKYQIKQLDPKDMTNYLTFLTGNDPLVTGLDKYKANTGKVALIGTSGLRGLKLISELSNQEHTPKLVIVDNCLNVIEFWRKLRDLVEKNHYASKDEFMAAFDRFLILNQGLYRAQDDRLQLFGLMAGVTYEEQDPRLFMESLLDKYGTERILSIIRHASIIAQGWEDRQTIIALKNILDLNGVEHIFAYPSNIEYCIEITRALQVEENWRALDPELTIRTDRCLHHGVPEQVELIAAQRTQPEPIIQPTVVSDSISGDKESTPTDKNRAPNIAQSSLYSIRLESLQTQANKQNPKLRNQLNEIIEQIKKLSEEKVVSQFELMLILDKTELRLNNKISAQEYTDLAKTVYEKPSTGMRSLGILMLAFGAALLVAGAVTSIAFGPLNLITVGAGVALLSAHFGFFRGEKPTALSKAMTEFNEQLSIGSASTKGYN